jgi:type II secretory pathway pseudopilin PulG
MKNPSPTRRKRSEQGYVLLMVIFLLALLIIALAVAAPRAAKQIQRDHELETMHRGKQYIRGIRMYYKKFGSYPPNADALYKPTNNIRFLRKKYADPTTGKEDWKPILYGQNKAPLAMGFFGQPLGGAAGGCVGSNPLGGGITSMSGSTSGSSLFGAPTGSDPSCLGTGLNSPGTTPPANPNAPVDPNAANSSGVPGSTTGLSGQTGQTFGGMGIIGFAPNSPKQSLMVYKTKKHYNEWEFVYSPQAEQLMQQMSGGVSTGPNGQPLGGGLGNNSGFGNNTGLGNNTGVGNAGGFGNNSGFGGSTTSPSPTPSSPAPQQ